MVVEQMLLVLVVKGLKVELALVRLYRDWETDRKSVV